MSKGLGENVSRPATPVTDSVTLPCASSDSTMMSRPPLNRVTRIFPSSAPPKSFSAALELDHAVEARRRCRS
jgi:hypothetical protein